MPRNEDTAPLDFDVQEWITSLWLPNFDTAEKRSQAAEKVIKQLKSKGTTYQQDPRDWKDLTKADCSKAV